MNTSKKEMLEKRAASLVASSMVMLELGLETVPNDKELAKLYLDISKALAERANIAARKAEREEA